MLLFIKQILYSASVDCSIGVWDVRSGERLRDLQGHENMILCLDVKILKDNKVLIVTGGDDHNLLCFN